MSEIIYYQRNRDKILIRAKEYIKITKNYCRNEQKTNIDHSKKIKKI